MSDTEISNRDSQRRHVVGDSTEPLNRNSLRGQVVDELKDYFNCKFSELKRDFREDSDWAVENAKKKVRTDNEISFRNTSNKKQYQFNNSVLDVLDSCTKAVNLKNATKAIAFLSEAKDKIKHRNKLIRIADNSSSGWLTIQEYELNDVASDSDDDRKIRKAEERAKSRLEKVKKTQTQSQTPMQSSDSGASSSDNNFFRGLRGRGAARAPMAGLHTGTRDVVCFICGNTGHYASGCAAYMQRLPTGSVGARILQQQSVTNDKSEVPVIKPESGKN